MSFSRLLSYFLVVFLAMNIATTAYSLTVTARGVETAGLPPEIHILTNFIESRLDSITRCGKVGKLFSQKSGTCISAAAPQYQKVEHALQFQQAPRGEWGKLVDIKGQPGVRGIPCNRLMCSCRDIEQVESFLCPYPLSGNGVRSRTQSCVTGIWGNWSITLPCEAICAPPESTSEEIACPSPLKGSYILIRDYICDKNGNVTKKGVRTEPPDISAACTLSCEPEVELRDTPCPNAPQQNYQQQRSFDCEANAWSSWSPATPPVNACSTCPDGQVFEKTLDLACGTGTNGATYKAIRRFDCKTKTWSDWDYSQQSSCPTPACDDKVASTTFSCGTGTNGASYKATKRFNCDTQTWSDWDHSAKASCPTCQEAVSSTVFSCGIGTNGASYKATKRFNCDTQTWSDWDHSAKTSCPTCQDIVRTRTENCSWPTVGTWTMTSTFRCATNSWTKWGPLPSPEICQCPDPNAAEQ